MKFLFNGKEWYINKLLARQLDSLVYNVKKDWDFVIIISGDRTVRVGKSVLGLTVAAYLCCAMKQLKLSTKFDIDDIYFDNKIMMDAAFKKPKYAINLYDEGREGLASNKSMQTMQKDLLDFFAECGQLNQIFIIVAPDFFKLNEEIGVARSEYLINVYRRDVPILARFGDEKRPVMRFDRGYFEFFDRKKKQNLYDKSATTRRKNYGLIKAGFLGDFTNQYPLGEEEYRNKKRAALARFKERKEKENEPAVRKSDIIRNRIIWDLKRKDPKMTNAEISKYMELNYEFDINPNTVSKLIVKMRKVGGAKLI